MEEREGQGKGRSPGSGSVDLEELYRLLIESVRDYAIFALDPEGYILSWNPGAERFKGYTADEVIGQHFSIFYTQDAKDREHPQYELREAIREGRYEEEGWRLRKDGTRFWASVTITALRDDTGTLVGFAKVTRDLTERRESEQRAIQDARRVAEAEAANRAKTEFLTSLSHELRTPLNAIGGYTDLILLGVRGPITSEMAQDLERVRESQQHLLYLINDLLSFSRMEAGQLTYNITPFSVIEVIDRVVGLVQPQALSKEITLDIGPCSPGLEAIGDQRKVEQILINLLTNATKFTGTGGRISVECHASTHDVQICVSDTGVGIPPEQQEAIFQPFVQLGRTLTSSHEGAGLGLAISRDLARAMNGDLAVVSRPGEGSTFTVTLPRGS